MSFFNQHIFFCTNQRAEGEPCCAQHGGLEAFEYTKTKVKAAGLADNNQVRVNKAGCLGRCDQGPVAVVYPAGVWYTWVDHSDLDEIVEQHLAQGHVVERLTL
jgi:(2Fe-2S) ferredoxin